MINLKKDNGCIIVGEPFITDCGGRKRKCVLARCRCSYERIVELSNWIKSTGLCKKCQHRQYVGEISGDYFSTVKCDAKRRGIKFDLTKEYIWDLFLKQNRMCKYTDFILVFGNGSKEKNNVRTASLDRIDSKGCYEEGNVQWIHQIVNYMKQKLSEEEFFFWINAISEKRKRDEEIFNTNRTRRELLHSVIVGPCISEFESSSGILGFSSQIAS